MQKPKKKKKKKKQWYASISLILYTELHEDAVRDPTLLDDSDPDGYYVILKNKLYAFTFRSRWHR